MTRPLTFLHRMLAMTAMTTALTAMLACSSESKPDLGANGDAGASAGGSPLGTGGDAGAVGTAGSASGGIGAGGSGGTVSGPIPDDVCMFRTPAPLGAPDAEGFVRVPANEPNVRWIGRIDCTNPAKPGMAFPGSTITLRFLGTDLDVELDDHGTGTKTTTNYFGVIIDGAAPVALESKPGIGRLQVARGLTAGEHTVTLIRRNESQVGKVDITGFQLRGQTLLPAPAKTRKVEFIGDSITCGYGNEVVTDTPDSFPFTSKGQNAWNAYGAVTARLLDADYSAVSYSGRGMYRNFSGGGGLTGPAFWELVLPDDPASPKWDVSRYVPDVVVVNLGTNDFSPGDVDPVAYETAATEFLAKLRTAYPAATLFAAIGPMLSDYYPVGANAWTTAKTHLKAAVDARIAAGDKDVHFHAFSPQSPPYGEMWHPTAATHESMANELAAEIKTLKGW